MSWQRRRRAGVLGDTGNDGLLSKNSELEPQEPCEVNSCSLYADKHLGGRSVSFQDAETVWGDSGLSGTGRRVRICRSCYKQLKKALKEDREHRW